MSHFTTPMYHPLHDSQLQGCSAAGPAQTNFMKRSHGSPGGHSCVSWIVTLLGGGEHTDTRLDQGVWMGLLHLCRVVSRSFHEFGLARGFAIVGHGSGKEGGCWT